MSARGDRAADAASSCCSKAAGPSPGLQDGQALRHYEFRDFLQHLGVDLLADANSVVTVAAHHMFASPLLPEWTEHFDVRSSHVYFFNRLTGESSWMHPQHIMFREVLDEVRAWRPDDPVDRVFARSDLHLGRARQRALDALAHWSGPHAVPPGPEETQEVREAGHFFFNAATGESRWVDPRLSMEFDLMQRHSILCECIVDHTQTLTKAAPSGAPDADGGRLPTIRVHPPDQGSRAPPASLPLPPRRSEASPPSPAARRPSLLQPPHAGGGDDSVRSCMSYLTAVSSGSCCEEARDDPDIHGDLWGADRLALQAS